MNVVHGHGIVSWAAIDTNRSNEQRDELIGFVTARVVAADDSEVGVCLVPVHEQFLVHCLGISEVKGMKWGHPGHEGRSQ